MIILLSPAKTQSNTSAKNSIKSESLALEKAQYLMLLLKTLSIENIEVLLKVSYAIAKKTKDAIAEWDNTAHNTAALYLFQGDAFQKLDAASLNENEITFAQEHVIILSALYGYLRPFDAVSAYRLDMNDVLKIPNYDHRYKTRIITQASIAVLE